MMKELMRDAQISPLLHHHITLLLHHFLSKLQTMMK
jgi:hypothetical protein